jgi:hypothetical protein
VPDELTPTAPAPAGAVQGTPPAPPQVAAGTAAASGQRLARRPSWLRAAIWSLVILAAGAALGGAGYRLERSFLIELPEATRTADGWNLAARSGHELSGLGLDGSRLIWQDGASIEYMDTNDGHLILLGPGAGMRVTWDPAVSDRYAVWFEAERQVSIAARLVVYDTVTGRRWTDGNVGSVRSYPALSGSLAVWCSAVRLGQPAILGSYVAGGGQLIPVADDDGAPVVSGGLVVWAKSWTGPFVAREIPGGSTSPVSASLTGDKLTGLALSGRTLVWGQGSDASGSGVVAAVDVDGGGQQTVASGITGLSGPSYDGRTVVWAERVGDAPTTAHSAHPYGGFRVMGRRLGDSSPFLIATAADPVAEVAVSGGTVAWIQKDAGSAYSIVVRRLSR